MFITNIFAARMLTQEIFGQFTMIRSTISMGSNFISGSLGISATEKVAEVNQTNKNDLTTLLISIFVVNTFAIIIFSLITSKCFGSI